MGRVEEGEQADWSQVDRSVLQGIPRLFHPTDRRQWLETDTVTEFPGIPPHCTSSIIDSPVQAPDDENASDQIDTNGIRSRPGGYSRTSLRVSDRWPIVETRSTGW